VVLKRKSEGKVEVTDANLHEYVGALVIVNVLVVGCGPVGATIACLTSLTSSRRFSRRRCRIPR
jgi:threonine dehydrogenase-like Zn-dependent dehydrogenase